LCRSGSSAELEFVGQIGLPGSAEVSLPIESMTKFAASQKGHL